MTELSFHEHDETVMLPTLAGVYYVGESHAESEERLWRESLLAGHFDGERWAEDAKRELGLRD